MHFEVREARTDKALTPLEDGFEVGEETALSLFVSEPLTGILWNGKPLEGAENYNREPFAWARNAYRWQLQLTDWVGRNEFTLLSKSGPSTLILYVYPAKLSSEPQEAWRLLRVIVGRIPRLAEGLNFPQEVRAPLTQGTKALEGEGGGQNEGWRDLAPRLYRLSERLLRAPEVRSGRRFTLERGGQVSGAVDWEATLDHWASGGAIGLEHVRDARVRVWDTPTYRLLLHLWDRLLEAAHQDSDAENLRALEAQRAQYRRALPGVGAWSEGDLRGVHPTLLELWREGALERTVYGGLPQGALGMAALFEVWVACELAALLGCTRRTALEESEGQLACSFEGANYIVDYNIPFQFQGVGRTGESFGARPDLFVRSSDSEEKVRFVVDVKYRNLSKLDPSAQRAINNQMRAYMGDYHARLGLVLWPGCPEMDPLTLESRGRLRGSLGAMQFCPQDSGAALRARLEEALGRVEMGPLFEGRSLASHSFGTEGRGRLGG